MANTEDLIQFVNIAEKNRIYPRGTADGYRAAIKLFDEVLNEEERESLTIITERLAKIYQEVIIKNQNRIKIQTLATYKSRMIKLIEDYNQFGQNAEKMANWTRPVKNRKRHSSGIAPAPIGQESPNQNFVPLPSVKMNRIELVLRPEIDTKALILLPFDLKNSEATLIKSLVDALIQPDNKIN